MMRSSSYTFSYLGSEKFDEIVEIYDRHFGVICKSENIATTIEHEVPGYTHFQLLDDYEEYVIEKKIAKSMVCIKIENPTYYRHRCWFMNDNNEYSLKITQAIPTILDELREKGYTAHK